MKASDQAYFLGEGPVWDHRSNTLFWVDIKNPGIWRYHPETKEHFRIDAPEPVPYQIDGDPAGTTPVTFTMQSRAVPVLVP